MTSLEIPIQTDRYALGNRINLPQNVTIVEWIIPPQGLSRNDIPGPTDTILYAVLKSNNNDWSSLPEAKPSLTSQDIAEVPIQVAKKLLSPEQLKKFPQVDGYVQIRGNHYEPSFFDKGSYRGNYAIVIDGNLLVCLHSM